MIAAKPSAMPRLFLTLAMGLSLAIAPTACQRSNTGAVKVAVIGATPQLREPTAGPINAGDAVLLANVAQGLVRFDARGQIEPGLAERWNVSDDGLSYIFRLASGNWPGGGKISAEQVARMLRRSLGRNSANPLKDTLGAVDEIVAMTDRVIEIRLRAPRPNLLQLLAQPEFALVRGGQGTGPFALRSERGPGGELWLRRDVAAPDGDTGQREDVLLGGAEAPAAIRDFAAGKLDMVLGGTFADLPHARAVQLPRRALVFDPVAGLFGLIPVRAGGILADPEVRRLLVQAIDRDALIEALDVPGLLGRATVLEPGLSDVPDPVAPPWVAIPIGERRPKLIADADGLLGHEDEDAPIIRLRLPEGPGSDILLRRLTDDWGLLGIKVERAGPGQPADLRLIDAVAPSDSPAWFLRQFRCEAAPLCDEEADKLLAAAREAPIAAQRAAFLAEAALLIDQKQLFIPLSAPVRWSLAARRLSGFAGNRSGRHTLTGLEDRLGTARR